MLDKNKFLHLMTGLGELYNQKITETLLEIYYKILSNYDYQELENAVNKVIRIHKYSNLPKPAEILEYLEGSQDDKALKAWLDVKEALKKGGYYNTIKFTDPIIPKCINDFGGWMEFCSLPEEEQPFIQKRFMDLYRLFLKRGEKDDKPLQGYIENHNKNLGERIPEPLVIGDRKNKQLKESEE